MVWRPYNSRDLLGRINQVTKVPTYSDYGRFNEYDNRALDIASLGGLGLAAKAVGRAATHQAAATGLALLRSQDGMDEIGVREPGGNAITFAQPVKD